MMVVSVSLVVALIFSLSTLATAFEDHKKEAKNYLHRVKDSVPISQISPDEIQLHDGNTGDEIVNPTNPPKPVVPTVKHKLVPTKDVALERGTQNFNNLNFLIVGKHPGFPKKRSILQFEDIPSSCTNIISAKMYIWYWYSHKASWQSDAQVPHLSHVLKAHQIKKEWVETEATSSIRKRGISWSQQWLGLDGTDADATPLDSVKFSNPPPTANRWIEFDITSAAQNWVNDQPNYGVVIWSDRENDNGRDLRFYSRERSSNKPYVNVECQ